MGTTRQHDERMVVATDTVQLQLQCAGGKVKHDISEAADTVQCVVYPQGSVHINLALKTSFKFQIS